MTKGSLPVPHIIAIVLGIVAIALMGYFFFQQVGIFGGEVSKQQCLQAVAQYCTSVGLSANWDAKYGSEPTKENCIDFQAGKYSACTQFKETLQPSKETPSKETGKSGTTTAKDSNNIVLDIKGIGKGVPLDTGAGLSVTGRAIVAPEPGVLEFSSIETLEFEITFGKLPESYELLIQYRKKADKDWKDYGGKRFVEEWPSYLISGSTLKFRTIPSLFIKESGTYQFRIIGAGDSVSSGKFELESNVKEITITQNPDGCGDKCSEEPPLPPGTDIITYCSKPLTVPNNELQDEYKNYPNVKKHKEGSDNRYLAYVSKTSSEAARVEIGNLDVFELEPLLEGVSLDGKEIYITDNTAFIIHGNPVKKNPILDLCGWWCDEKSLELKPKTKKLRLYATENCTELTGTIINGLLGSTYSDGIKPGVLYASMFYLLENIKSTIAKTIQSATLDTPLNTDTISVKFEVEIGGEPVPLIEGAGYGVGGGASSIYTTRGEVGNALAFARGLKDLKTPEEKIEAIDRWVAENGVYPSETVVRELNADLNPHTGEPNKFKNPALADFASKFDTAELKGSETLTNIMGNKLADGRFLCVCRDISLLATAMARESGVDASMADGLVSRDGSLNDFKRPDGLDNLNGHSWVRFKNSEGRLADWDPTASLAEELFKENPPVFRTSLNDPEKFKRQFKLGIPSIRTNGEVISARIVENGKAIDAYGMSPTGEVHIATMPESYAIIEWPDTNILTYELDLKLTDPSKIPVLRLGYTSEPYLDSFKASVLESSKVPIILDRTHLIPINPEKFPKKILEAIDLFNEGYQAHLKNPPDTPEKLIISQLIDLTELRRTIKDIGVTPSPEDLETLKSSMEQVKARLNKLERGNKMMDTISHTLDTAINSPLKGKLVTVQKLKSNPKLAEAYGVSSKAFGVGAGIATTFGLVFEDYSESIDNANLVLLSRSINAANTATLPVAGGIAVKQIVSAGLAGGTSAALGATGSVATSFGISYGVGAVVSAMGTTVYCILNAKSPLCGCRVSDDYDGNLLVELEKYAVKKGETIKYRVLGFENCPTPLGFSSVFGLINLGGISQPVALYERSLLGGLFSGGYQLISGPCKFQESGRWCLGEFNANLDPGAHEIYIGYLIGSQDVFLSLDQKITVTS